MTPAPIPTLKTPRSLYHPSRLIVIVKDGIDARQQPLELNAVQEINQRLQAHPEARHLWVVAVKYNPNNVTIVNTWIDQSATDLARYFPLFADILNVGGTARCFVNEKWHKVQIHRIDTGNRKSRIRSAKEVYAELVDNNPELGGMELVVPLQWMKPEHDLQGSDYLLVVLTPKHENDVKLLKEQGSLAAFGWTLPTLKTVLENLPDPIYNLTYDSIYDTLCLFSSPIIIQTGEKPGWDYLPKENYPPHENLPKLKDYLNQLVKPGPSKPRVAKDKARRGISESSCTSQATTLISLEVPQTSSPSPITFGGSPTPVVPVQTFAAFAPTAGPSTVPIIQEPAPQYPTGTPIVTQIPHHFGSYRPPSARSPSPDPPRGSPNPNPSHQPDDSDDNMAGDSKGPILIAYLWAHSPQVYHISGPIIK
ncbi:hypothetical protein JAAARDRAFT_199788 [Jaapia argillacea MUCL 33604]|uniref:Uncharacterized protein n=1 Tax=Jaapia argillacea MUCL 33604 TaxID=933084 RepID=A0A067PHZ5_9AGAM|nr:hypothetical protein JAAARDRAFT_199788 [Jaapia argillacea MUCL 33604]